MKDNVITLLIVIISVAVMIILNVKNVGHKMEIQNLNRQLIECRLTCNNQEMIEVLDQCLSPLAMDELRLAAKQLKQQKLRSIFKQREKQSNEN